MKMLRFFAVVVSVSLLCPSCLVVSSRPAPPPAGRPVSSKPLPPGQAKKVYGTQSAKPFAPGQQKKKR